MDDTSYFLYLGYQYVIFNPKNNEIRYAIGSFLNGPTPASSFVYFQHKFYKKTVGFSRTWTRIVGVEGKQADHLTTTTALASFVLKNVNILLVIGCAIMA